jgi:shikimate kinase
MKNITLVGFMGTGKTTVGKLLAKRLGYRFVDSDDEIESEQGVSITHIFSELGEAHFRDLETDMLKRLSKREGLVISAGGGAVIRAENVENLKKGGPVVCLAATPEEIYERVKHSTHRPLLKVDDPLGRIRELLDLRRKFYSRADFTVDTGGLGPEEVVGRILKRVKGEL